MKYLKAILLLFVAVLLTGCVAFHRAQLEGKLPRIDAAEVTVTLSTIYGVSGSIREENVAWNGDVKSLSLSELRITSPLGSYHRVVKQAAAKPPVNTLLIGDVQTTIETVPVPFTYSLHAQ